MIPTRDKNGDLNSATLSFEEDWLHIGLTVHLHLLSLRAWRVLKLDTYFSSAKIFVLFDICLCLGTFFTWMILHINWSTSSPSSKAGLLKFVFLIQVSYFGQTLLWFSLFQSKVANTCIPRELTCILGISTSPFHSWAWDTIPGQSTATGSISKSKSEFVVEFFSSSIFDQLVSSL